MSDWMDIMTGSPSAAVPKKCGTCFNFIVKPDEIAIAQHAPPISECQPGKPHCLGGQVRGSCTQWEERAEKGYPMPWGMGPMVESVFNCPLWKPGGPRPRMAGGRNIAPTRTKALASLGLGLTAIFAATRMKLRGSKASEQPLVSRITIGMEGFEQEEGQFCWFLHDTLLALLSDMGIRDSSPWSDEERNMEKWKWIPGNYDFTVELAAPARIAPKALARLQKMDEFVTEGEPEQVYLLPEEEVRKILLADPRTQKLREEGRLEECYRDYAITLTEHPQHAGTAREGPWEWNP